MDSSKTRPLGPGLLLRLPPELLDGITQLLPNSDIKCLRLACAYLGRIAQLHIPRVFLSPNPVDVDVLRAVADHETLRKKVVEIVYDDTRFPFPLGDDDAGYWDEDTEETSKISDIPISFVSEYRKKAAEILGYTGSDAYLLETENVKSPPVSLVKSYGAYRGLVQGQERVLATDGDVEALEYGLQRFPHLRRITLTPALHGYPGTTPYSTPMLRSLPHGTIYPIAYGWPLIDRRGNSWSTPHSWEGEEKEKWRGFCLVNRTVAQHLRENPGACISDLVIDVNHLLTGLSCRIFENEENDEYKDLLTILGHPGFSHIDLALFSWRYLQTGSLTITSGHLPRALAAARDLQHVSLSTNFLLPDRDGDTYEENDFVPLRAIFPIEAWPNLRHFGLSNFPVKQDDLMSFLLELPPTLRSVELSLLTFYPEHGNYASLLEEMRDRLAWHERAVADRPEVIICMDPGPQGWGTPEYVKVDEFLYSDGKNPLITKIAWGSYGQGP